MGLASKLAAAQGGAPPGGAYGGAPPPASYQQQQQQGAPKPGGYSADVDMQNSPAKLSTKPTSLK
ncbi:hypothetical protein AUEXF2481DRAFT_5968 [Aureobasidium subglaciale EXF-2481]|uniref:Uncharacterized protein n=1 Tax=Aureobasidium subglaciale (strain EXF-2481) TaxID=1043005 RepID=A0A074YEJ3_AURSE|nr:uncharacterized protein AUEXF2481DRAFT_5968 [Aureobasidium subglaciale EXF-2481]KEQ94484.1 hypothetical protein AUEXF2481DRAFT_5968 [Aureobasidium subglaciale EXF-2481]